MCLEKPWLFWRAHELPWIHCNRLCVCVCETWSIQYIGYCWTVVDGAHPVNGDVDDNVYNRNERPTKMVVRPAGCQQPGRSS